MNKQERREYNKKWRQEHPDYSKKYIKAHRAERNVLRKEWKKKDPIKARIYWRLETANRRARKHGIKETLKIADWNQLVAEYIGQCIFCGKTEPDVYKMSIDHKIPFNKGGQNIVSNLQFLCKKCNGIKSDN